MIADDRPAPTDGARRRVAKGSRAAGALSLLLMLIALPIGTVGAFVYLGSSPSYSMISGGSGGLAGLGVVAGIVLMVSAACSFILGAVLFVRNAKG